jgi:deazaflavin-dependent oxidoreductase (nitroreductase family)
MASAVPAGRARPRTIPTPIGDHMAQTQHPTPSTAPHISDVNRPIVEEFRANGGRVGGPFEGGDLLLLTTVGATSGREHTTPLGYIRHGDRLLVVGSAGGSPRHPDWYHNLLAHPMVRVEVGSEMFDAIAIPAEGADRDRLFDRIVREQPGYGDYQAGVARRLPVVALERAHAEGGPEEIATLYDKLIEIHTWLREQLRRVRVETDAYFAARSAHSGPGAPRAGLGLQLRQHCLAFCESLEFHHTSEEAGLLPAMDRHHPHLRGVVERLRAEHRTVERIRGELVALLADMAGADPDVFTAEVERMSRELVAHLDYEEANLLEPLAALPFPPHAPGGAPQTEGA